MKKHTSLLPSFGAMIVSATIGIVEALNGLYFWAVIQFICVGFNGYCIRLLQKSRQKRAKVLLENDIWATSFRVRAEKFHTQYLNQLGNQGKSP